MKFISGTRMVTGQFGIVLDASIVKAPPCSPKNLQSLKRDQERGGDFFIQLKHVS